VNSTVPGDGISSSGSFPLLKITIIAIGKDKDAWVSDGAAHFEKLLGRWCRIHWRMLNSPVKSSSLSPDEIRRAESEPIRRELGRGHAIALTDRGRRFTSEEFATHLERLQVSAGGEILFVIGGPYGLDQSVLDRADEQLSLSPLTFSHQLVRLVLLEQLYRGFSILHGTDYHK